MAVTPIYITYYWCDIIADLTTAKYPEISSQFPEKWSLIPYELQ